MGLLARLKVFRIIHRFSLVITIKPCPCTYRPACKLVPLLLSSCYAMITFQKCWMALCCALRNNGRSFVKQQGAWGIFAFQSCKCHVLCFYQWGAFLLHQFLPETRCARASSIQQLSLLLGELWKIFALWDNPSADLIYWCTGRKYT